MSRILENRKLWVMVVAIMFFELLCYSFGVSLIVLVIITIIGFAVLVIDYKAYRCFTDQMEPLNPMSLIRNVDYIVVGEPCDVSEFISGSKSIIQISVPGVSQEGAFLIIRRTHSILNENGTVIMVLKRENMDKKPGLLETFFMHQVTIKEYGLVILSKLRKIVLLLKPIETLQMLVGVKETGYAELRGGGTAAMKEFCEERNINLRIMVE